MPDAADRASTLAEHEDLEILSSALFTALECDLSGLGWPGNSRVMLSSAEEEVHALMRLADD